MNATAPKWIAAPSSGILHVAGVGYPRREIKDGVQLLCGWVITLEKSERPRDGQRAGKKCAGCEAFLRKSAKARA